MWHSGMSAQGDRFVAGKGGLNGEWSQVERYHHEGQCQTRVREMIWQPLLAVLPRQARNMLLEGIGARTWRGHEMSEPTGSLLQR